MIWGYPYFRKPPFMEQTWDVNGSRMSCEEFDPSKKRALKKCIYVDPTFESLTEITQKCIHMLGLDKVDKQTIASKIAFLPRNNSWIYLSIYRSIYLSIYRSQFWCQKVGLSRLFCVILCHIVGPSKCDWQRAKSAIVRFLVAHYFSVQTQTNAAFGCPGIYIHKINRRILPSDSMVFVRRIFS